MKENQEKNKAQPKNNQTFQVILGCIFGFLGGIVATLLIFGLGKVPEIPKEHPLFSMQFLGFILLIAMVAIFYKPIYSLLTRKITIKWGDKEINISDIGENVDTQFNYYDSKLADLSDDLQEIKNQIPLKKDTITEPGEILKEVIDSAISKIRKDFQWVKSDDLANIVYHLGITPYKWRNQDSLYHKTAIMPQVIDELVSSVPEHIIRGLAKSGNVIYRLTDKDKGLFRQTGIIEN